MASPPSRPPISCHILNTVTGLPASSVPVSLTLLRPYGPSKPLKAITNADGRVTEWTTPAGGPSLEEIFANAREHGLSPAVLGAQADAADTDAEERTGRVGQRPGAGVRTASVQEELVLRTGESGEQGHGTGQMVWALTFDVGEYFQGEGFWTEVEVRFKTEVKSQREGGEAARSHWHVPLLLSPWSYTTYRGS